jgi:3-hydroxyisobutyrate dehydrogenase-like beta-hydroxyacid dehydrogenase
MIIEQPTLMLSVLCGVLILCVIHQAEGLGLAKAADLPLQDLLSILDLGAMACPMLKTKVRPTRRADQPRSDPPLHPFIHAYMIYHMIHAFVKP